MPAFNSDGVEIAFLDQGAGTPILLIHGFASNMAVNWLDTGWVRLLAREGYRVIAFDNRGHGRSGKLYDPKAYEPAVMAEDARRLLDRLAVAEAHVMGYSMGARIAAYLALAHPERVRSCIFGGLGTNMVRGLTNTGVIAQALEAASIDRVTDPVARTFRAFAEHTGSDLNALAACMRSPRHTIAAENLAKIACPVLIAVGTSDTTGGSAAELAALIPGAETLDITGRDHMKTVGDRLYKEGVLAFLGEVARHT